MGGSTNTVLHTLAIAHEGRDRLPAGAHQRGRRPRAAPVQGQPGRAMAHGRCAPRRRRPGHPERSCSAAGGLLHLDRLTVTGTSLRESIAGAAIQDDEVIRRLRTRIPPRGGLAILFGNLAPEGAVVKTGGVSPAMRRFSGPARIYESQEEAMAGILGGRGPAGRCGGDPLRRAERRAGDAGNAQPDQRHHGHGAGRAGGPDHRRALLRRDARRLHRARLPRSGRRRADRRAAGRAM